VTEDEGDTTISLKEHHLYGSSRLGMEQKNQVLYSYILGTPAEPQIDLHQKDIGDKRFELSNHLGNVLSVISDKKIPTLQGSSLSYFNADIKAYNDYYPFGMPMPNRNIEGQYRYAYQGQEKDPETGMEAFELRLWDARIGRWLTTDPAGQYSSPYLGMGNNPVSRVDPDGGEDNDIFTNSTTGESTEVVTNDAFDRTFVDGVLTGTFDKGALDFGKFNITNTINDFSSFSSSQIPYVNKGGRTIGAFKFTEFADTQTTRTGATQYGNVVEGKYFDLSNEYKYLSWYQTFTRRGVGKGNGQFIDSNENYFPFYPLSYKGNNGVFIDFPNSTNKNNLNITWNAELSLTGVHKATGEQAVLFTYGYGYFITPRLKFGPTPGSGFIQPSSFHLNGLKQ